MKKSERRPPRAAEPETNQPPREDPHATPLGRGADPGEKEGTDPLSGGPSVAGRRGMGVPGERGGPSGMVDRENEDVTPTARVDKGHVGPDAKANAAERAGSDSPR